MNNKDFREDRCCESCGQSGAALVSEDAEDEPHWLCKPCMEIGLKRTLSTEEIITMVERHWGIEADASVDKCPNCGSDRIHVRSIDKTRYFIKCGCATIDGFTDSRFYRIG